MKIFIAGTSSHEKIVKKNMPISFVLESFYYWKDWQDALLKTCDDFLLDSGAFTFMQSSKKKVIWEDYIERYADFINRNKIEKFFELDIDSVVGYPKVLEYRARLERLTNKPVIPVWHISRGIQDFYSMCDKYNYVALGGIVGEKRGGAKYKQYHAAFPFFISEAHKRGSKIHGLGFTSTSLFNKIKFDSVDSTTWTVGSRMGNLCYFNGNGMRQFYPSLRGKKPTDIEALMDHNLREWVKFQKWALKNIISVVVRHPTIKKLRSKYNEKNIKLTSYINRYLCCNVLS